MKQTLITILATLLGSAAVVTLGAYGYINSGLYDVSASTPDSALVAWAAHTTSEASVARRYPANIVPVGLDAPERIAQGAATYRATCAVCHGGPGLAVSSISKGLNPQPPYLFEADREPDPAEDYQFVSHGIKMSGMPAFSLSKSEAEMWSIVAFLKVAPGLSDADFAKLSPAPISN